jgi:hypothetical protein
VDRKEIEAELIEAFRLDGTSVDLCGSIDRAIALHRLSPVAMTAAMLLGMVNVPCDAEPVVVEPETTEETSEASDETADVAAVVVDAPLVEPQEPIQEPIAEPEQATEQVVVAEPVPVVPEPVVVAEPTPAEVVAEPVVEPAPVSEVSEPIAQEPPKPLTEAEMIRALLKETPTLTNGQVMDQLALAGVNVTGTQIKQVRTKIQAEASA